MAEQNVGDPRFYERRGPFGIAALAAAAGGAAGPTTTMFTGIGPLGTATADQVSFLDNRRYAEALDGTRAGAVIVTSDMAARVPAAAVPIVVAGPYESWARVAALFHPIAAAGPAIHATAVVGPGAVVHPTACIGAYAVIGAGGRDRRAHHCGRGNDHRGRRGDRGGMPHRGERQHHPRHPGRTHHARPGGADPGRRGSVSPRPRPGSSASRNSGG